MTLSLRARISLVITVIMAVLSAVSIGLFTKMDLYHLEKEVVAKGMALSYSLSKSAEVGLREENLNLLERAQYIVHDESVRTIQIFSNHWEPIDAYPLASLKIAPDEGAIAALASTGEPFYSRHSGDYDFYRPIVFSPGPSREPMTIGFVRLSVSAGNEMKDIRKTMAMSVAVALVLAVIAVATIYSALGKLVIRPVLALHEAASSFKNGRMPETTMAGASKEMKDLSEEFHSMCVAVRENEVRLQQSEERIKAFFERVDQSIFRLDTKGNIVEINGRFKDIFGWRGQLCEIMSKDDESFDCKMFFAGEDTVQRETQVFDAHGHEMTVILSLYRDIQEDGGLAGYDGYMIDITEKKRLQENLIRVQRLEAVGTLAGGIAHDFNNLLAAILGYAELLADSAPNESSRKYATIILNAAQRGADLTNKMLSTTRKDNFRMLTVNINDVISETIELLKRTIPKNIEIVISPTPDLPLIEADPSQLQQALINLALNSRDSMPDGGTLTIETRAVETDDSDPAAAQKARKYVKIMISDTGTGMTRDVQGKIFSPFFTTKDMGKGTGLGLYMVYSIVTNHNGHINVYSEQGRGTRISVYLPVIKSAATKPAAQLAKAEAGSGTILVIDDEPHVREILMDMLVPLGYEVLLADGGDEGLRIFSERHFRISLVILDMIMPRMDGGEVFSRLMAIDPGVKVIICSGFSQNGYIGIDALIKSGAKGFLQKPFTRTNLVSSIKSVISAV